jgi:lipoprotein-releasing system ATP-binding protein
MLRATNISKSYGDLKVLKNISLQIEQGEMVSIMGKSGAGKSTLLQILGTLDNADTGEVYINNQLLSELSSNKLAAFRNKNIGFVFQFHNLLPEFTALENVCIPGFLSKSSKNEVEERATKLLTRLGLSQRLHHKPSALSGGEQQRTAVARALLNNPSVVFADEPTGNLDSKNAQEMHELFLELKSELNQTFVIVTHNESLATMADRSLTMVDGNWK